MALPRIDAMCRDPRRNAISGTILAWPSVIALIGFFGVRSGIASGGRWGEATHRGYGRRCREQSGNDICVARARSNRRGTAAVGQPISD